MSFIPQPVGVPAPHPSPRSVPYWDGCREGELRYQQCQDCGHINRKPGVRCTSCLRASLAWKVSSGRGSLYSWTVVWRPQHPLFHVPYAPAVVVMEEGFYVMSAMIGCTSDDLRDGLPVAVEFHPVSDEITLPYFRPVA
jgi:uncharacterized OB-fold protein